MLIIKEKINKQHHTLFIGNEKHICINVNEEIITTKFPLCWASPHKSFTFKLQSLCLSLLEEF